MMTKQPGKMFIPALWIVAMVITLLVIISISTYRTLDRDKRKAMKFIRRECLVLSNAIEAGLRSEYMGCKIKKPEFKQLIEESVKIRDVAYILLIDEKGKIINSADNVNAVIPGYQAWPPSIHTGKIDETWRYQTLADHTKVYELARRLPVFGDDSSRPYGVNRNTLVVALKMKPFEDAHKNDFHHSILMAAIVFALGSGAIFFIFVIQNYYLTNQTLKQARDYNRLVVEHMANGLVSIDRQGNIQTYNHLAAELLGIDDYAFVGADFKDIINFGESGINETLNSCTNILEKEIQFPAPNDESSGHRPLALSVTPIVDEKGDCSGAVIILRDLTEIKQLEEKVRRSEKLAAIGKLAASVAHEIRNPLSSIKGFTRLILNVLTNFPKESKYANVMMQEIDRINRVVSDLLVFARPLDLDLKPTDIRRMISHVAMLAEIDADSKCVTIKTHCDSDMGLVPLDMSQMTSVLFNLVLNALQSMEKGGRIDIGAAMNKTGDLSSLRLWVEDDGPGIPPDKRKTIFEPFFTTREKGTGLGLAIVGKIVENHGGEINMESPVPGKINGCRFNIFISLDE